MKQKRLKGTNNQGFTLVEIIIAMVISAVILGAVYRTYRFQQKSYVVQDQVSVMQQNLRAAMYHMATDLRTAGYDPLVSGNFGVTDVFLRNGNSSLEFTTDQDEDTTVDANETIYYCIFNYPIAAAAQAQMPALARIQGGVAAATDADLLALNIQALGIAYAFDVDNDLNTDLDTTASGNIIWAVDSDNDNDLDVNLDADDNGVIDAADDQNGDGIINSLDEDPGATLAADVNMADIRAARVWLLARSDREDIDFANTRTYVVANQVITPNDGVRRRLQTSTIEFRNLGLTNSD